jgi:hypothetical protein
MRGRYDRHTQPQMARRRQRFRRIAESMALPILEVPRAVSASPVPWVSQASSSWLSSTFSTPCSLTWLAEVVLTEKQISLFELNETKVIKTRQMLVSNANLF